MTKEEQDVREMLESGEANQTQGLFFIGLLIERFMDDHLESSFINDYLGKEPKLMDAILHIGDGLHEIAKAIRGEPKAG